MEHVIRGNKCFVPGCNTDWNLAAKPGLQDGLAKKTFFKAPEDKILLERWRRNIPKVGRYLIPGIFVCEVHFSADSIERFKEVPSSDGGMTLVRRSTPVLKPSAVPTIFPNLPTSLVEKLKKVERPCGLPLKASLPQKQYPKPSRPPELIDISRSDGEEENEKPVNDNEISSSHSVCKHICSSSNSKAASRKKSSSDNRVSSSTQDSNVIPEEDMKVAAALPRRATNNRNRNRIRNNSQKQIKKKTRVLLKKGSSDPPTTTIKDSDSKEGEMNNPISYNGVEGMESNGEDSLPFDDKYQILVTGFESDDEQFSFQKLKFDLHELTMPSPSWSYSCLHEAVSFIDWGWYYETRKKIIVTKNLMYRIFVRDKEIKLEGFDGPKSLVDMDEMLQIVEAIPVCWGMGAERGWSKNCTGHVPYREGPVRNAAKSKCDACLEEMKATPGKKRKEERKRQRIVKLIAELSSERSKNKILLKMVQKLKRRNSVLSLKLSALESPEGSIGSNEANEDNNLDEVIDKEYTLAESNDKIV